jgi:hypothetical protein
MQRNVFQAWSLCLNLALPRPTSSNRENFHLYWLSLMLCYCALNALRHWQVPTYSVFFPVLPIRSSRRSFEAVPPTQTFCVGRSTVTLSTPGVLDRTARTACPKPQDPGTEQPRTKTFSQPPQVMATLNSCFSLIWMVGVSEQREHRPSVHSTLQTIRHCWTTKPFCGSEEVGRIYTVPSGQFAKLLRFFRAKVSRATLHCAGATRHTALRGAVSNKAGSGRDGGSWRFDGVGGHRSERRAPGAHHEH